MKIKNIKKDSPRGISPIVKMKALPARSFQLLAFMAQVKRPHDDPAKGMENPNNETKTIASVILKPKRPKPIPYRMDIILTGIGTFFCIFF